MIRVRELTKYYGDKLAIDHISFDVRNGEILGFLGPNGAGKTTTMKIITGYMLPTSGTVEVDDLNIYEHSMEIRKKIGYLPENNPLYDEMPIIDFLKFIGEIRGIPKPRLKERLEYVIQTCGLGDELGKEIGVLSQGYRQRVGLAQALLHDPEILILDEPTLGLDPNQVMEITELIKEIGRQKTVMVSTHILPWVEENCDRVVILHRGRVVADGTIDELKKRYPNPEGVSLEDIFHDLTLEPEDRELLEHIHGGEPAGVGAEGTSEETQKGGEEQ